MVGDCPWHHDMATHLNNHVLHDLSTHWHYLFMLHITCHKICMNMYSWCDILLNKRHYYFIQINFILKAVFSYVNIIIFLFAEIFIMSLTSSLRKGTSSVFDTIFASSLLSLSLCTSYLSSSSPTSVIYLNLCKASVGLVICSWVAYFQDIWMKPTGEPRNQSCNETSSKILGEGCWNWMHDFVATFRVNDRPLYMTLWL